MSFDVPQTIGGVTRAAACRHSIVSSLPTRASGKVDEAALRRLAEPKS